MPFSAAADWAVATDHILGASDWKLGKVFW